LAKSADFKGGTLNKHRNGLIGDCFEMPNVSYTHPLAVTRNDQSTYFNGRLKPKKPSHPPPHILTTRKLFLKKLRN